LELRLLAVVCHKDSLVAEQRAITSQGTNHTGSNFCDERNPIYRVSRRERSVLHVFRLKREPYAMQGSSDRQTMEASEGAKSGLRNSSRRKGIGNNVRTQREDPDGFQARASPQTLRFHFERNFVGG
jgi:hypothetical protein